MAVCWFLPSNGSKDRKEIEKNSKRTAKPSSFANEVKRKVSVAESLIHGTVSPIVLLANFSNCARCAMTRPKADDKNWLVCA